MRLMNTEVNPFVRQFPLSEQKSIYLLGDANPIGLEGGVPTWVFTELPAVQGFDTADTTIVLPENFWVLSLLGLSLGGSAFKAWFYDVNRKLALMDRTVVSGALMGTGQSPLFLRVPYQFEPPEASCAIRVVNQTNTVNDIMVALYGVVGGQQ
jgi:hypothetical protein